MLLPFLIDPQRFDGLLLRLLAAERNPSLGLAPLHQVPNVGLLSPPLDGARRDLEPGGDLLVGALQLAQLLEFRQIDLDRPAAAVNMTQLETERRIRQFQERARVTCRDRRS